MQPESSYVEFHDANADKSIFVNAARVLFFHPEPTLIGVTILVLDMMVAGGQVVPLSLAVKATVREVHAKLEGRDLRPLHERLLSEKERVN